MTSPFVFFEYHQCTVENRWNMWQTDWTMTCASQISETIPCTCFNTMEQNWRTNQVYCRLWTTSTLLRWYMEYTTCLVVALAGLWVVDGGRKPFWKLIRGASVGSVSRNRCRLSTTSVARWTTRIFFFITSYHLLSQPYFPVSIRAIIEVSAVYYVVLDEPWQRFMFGFTRSLDWPFPVELGSAIFLFGLVPNRLHIHWNNRTWWEPFRWKNMLRFVWLAN